MFRSRKRLVVPDALKKFMLRHYHGLPLSGHQGRNRAYAHLSGKFYWRGMWTDVRDWVRSCLVCAKRKTPRPLGVGFPLMMPVGAPMRVLAVDVIGRLIETLNGYCYLLVAIDVFTRFPICVPLKTTTAKEVAEALFKHVLCLYGCPDKILTDRGAEFVNGGLAAICDTWGIHKLQSSTRHKQGNSHVERYIRWVNSSMSTLSAKFGNEWDNYVDACTFAYRVSVNDSTGYSPYRLMFGRDPVVPTDLLFGLQHKQQFASEREYAIECSSWMHSAYTHVRAQQERAAELNQDSALKRVKVRDFEKGDSVLYWQPRQSSFAREDEISQDGFVHLKEKSTNAPGKWRPRWTGPHEILQRTGESTYDLRDGTTARTVADVHVDTLWPFHPWSDDHMSTSYDVDRIAPWKFGKDFSVGDLLAIPLAGGGFGIGRLLNLDERPLLFQWLSNHNDSYAASSSVFLEGWKDSRGNHYYGRRTGRNEVPYTSVDTGSKVDPSGVMLYGFSLTKTSRLPVPVRRTITRLRVDWDELDTEGMPNDVEDELLDAKAVQVRKRRY